MSTMPLYDVKFPEPLDLLSMMTGRGTMTMTFVYDDLRLGAELGVSGYETVMMEGRPVPHPKVAVTDFFYKDVLLERGFDDEEYSARTSNGTVINHGITLTAQDYEELLEKVESAVTIFLRDAALQSAQAAFYSAQESRAHLVTRSEGA